MTQPKTPETGPQVENEQGNTSLFVRFKAGVSGYFSTLKDFISSFNAAKSEDDYFTALKKNTGAYVYSALNETAGFLGSLTFGLAALIPAQKIYANATIQDLLAKIVNDFKNLTQASVISSNILGTVIAGAVIGANEGAFSGFFKEKEKAFKAQLLKKLKIDEKDESYKASLEGKAALFLIDCVSMIPAGIAAFAGVLSVRAVIGFSLFAVSFLTGGSLPAPVLLDMIRDTAIIVAGNILCKKLPEAVGTHGNSAGKDTFKFVYDEAGTAAEMASEFGNYAANQMYNGMQYAGSGAYHAVTHPSETIRAAGNSVYDAGSRMKRIVTNGGNSMLNQFGYGAVTESSPHPEHKEPLLSTQDKPTEGRPSPSSSM